MVVLLDHQKLRKALFDAQISQETFAEHVGISDRYVRKLNSRDSNVTINVFYKICTVLEMPMESMLVIHQQKFDE